MAFRQVNRRRRPIGPAAGKVSPVRRGGCQVPWVRFRVARGARPRGVRRRSASSPTSDQRPASSAHRAGRVHAADHEQDSGDADHRSNPAPAQITVHTLRPPSRRRSRAEQPSRPPRRSLVELGTRSGARRSRSRPRARPHQRGSRCRTALTSGDTCRQARRQHGANSRTLSTHCRSPVVFCFRSGG
jgi:hypothetical protein